MWTFYNASGQRLSSVANAALRSTIVSGTRTASAGTGAQSITGAGFQPTSVIAFASVIAANLASWGMGDDAGGEAATATRNTATFDSSVGHLISIDSLATDKMTAVLTSLDSDGCTITWTKGGSGKNVAFDLLFLR